MRTLIAEHPPTTVIEALELLDNCIASVIRALRTAVHRTLRVSPGALVFQRDMLLPIPVLANYDLVRERRQVVVDDNNRRANLRRHFKDYNVGDRVLLIKKSGPKLSPKALGPYAVVQVHVNGTITIQRSQNVLERVNIRRVKPYYD